MEVMDASLDKFYQTVYNNGQSIPEDVLGKISYAVSSEHKIEPRYDKTNTVHLRQAWIQTSLIRIHAVRLQTQ
jgi:hypothetical protein